MTRLQEANLGLHGVLEEDAHSCKRYHLQIDEEEKIFAEAIDYMTMHALWDPPASGRHCCVSLRQRARNAWAS